MVINDKSDNAVISWECPYGILKNLFFFMSKVFPSITIEPNPDRKKKHSSIS